MKICVGCGSRHLVAFADETLLAGEAPVTGLFGTRCAECGETYLDARSQARYAAALEPCWPSDRKSKPC